jgi:hypothetical protein
MLCLRGGGLRCCHRGRLWSWCCPVGRLDIVASELCCYGMPLEWTAKEGASGEEDLEEAAGMPLKWTAEGGGASMMA